MKEILKKYLRTIGKKGGQAKTQQKAAAARRNGKLGGRPKKKGGIMKTVILLVSIFIGSISTAIAQDSPSEIRFKLGKLLYPKGFTSKEIGSLDRYAASRGMVEYRNGRQFNRAELQMEIASKIYLLRDVDLLELRQLVSQIEKK